MKYVPSILRIHKKWSKNKNKRYEGIDSILSSAMPISSCGSFELKNILYSFNWYTHLITFYYVRSNFSSINLFDILTRIKCYLYTLKCLL